MILTHKTSDSVEIVQFTGRLDMAEAPGARQAIREMIDQGAEKLILDLGSVDFMDSSGLSVLVSTLRAAEAKGGEVLLLNLTPNVRALIELTRLQHIFEIFENEQAAIEHLVH